MTNAKFEDMHETFKDDNVKRNVIDIFDRASKLKQKSKDNNTTISEEIYNTKVPSELVYDKDTNNDGLKPGDFKKLVDLKAKQLTAKSDEDKEKLEQKLQDAAADKQFEMARAELMRNKLSDIENF